MDSTPDAFPSLSDTALKQLNIFLKNSLDESEQELSKEDLENKFMSLMLAFKTDKMTLKRRYERQNRLRDQADVNMSNEIESLKTDIEVLSTSCPEPQSQEVFERLRVQVEATLKASQQVSRSSEIYGAVQQENRLSKAVDIILNHVETLREALTKEKAEHQETRRLLNEQKLALPLIRSKNKRRASIATLHRESTRPDDTPPPGETTENRLAVQQSSSTHSIDDPTSHDHSCQVEGPPLDGVSQERGESRVNSVDSCRLTQQVSSEMESDSDEEPVKQELPLTQILTPKPLPQRYKCRKRSSLCGTPWMMKKLEWAAPYEGFALQARYAVAGLLVALALAILSSSFLAPSAS